MYNAPSCKIEMDNSTSYFRTIQVETSLWGVRYTAKIKLSVEIFYAYMLHDTELYYCASVISVFVQAGCLLAGSPALLRCVITVFVQAGCLLAGSPALLRCWPWRHRHAGHHGVRCLHARPAAQLCSWPAVSGQLGATPTKPAPTNAPLSYFVTINMRRCRPA